MFADSERQVPYRVPARVILVTWERDFDRGVRLLDVYRSAVRIPDTARGRLSSLLHLHLQVEHAVRCIVDCAQGSTR